MTKKWFLEIIGISITIVVIGTIFSRNRGPNFNGPWNKLEIHESSKMYTPAKIALVKQFLTSKKARWTKPFDYWPPYQKYKLDCKYENRIVANLWVPEMNRSGMLIAWATIEEPTKVWTLTAEPNELIQLSDILSLPVKNSTF